MRNLLSLWVMTLTLVLLVSGGALAEIDPILDGGLNPNTGLDEGSQDGDHPWGGDQTPTETSSPLTSTTSLIRPSRVIVTTTIIPIDPLITDFICSFFIEESVAPEVSRIESAAITKERSTHARSRVLRSSGFDKKKGVAR